MNSIEMEGNIIHNGDTNTYHGFHAADQWRVVTGGTERLEVNNDTITMAAILSMSSHYIHMNGNDITGVDQLIAQGDTNTYLRFHSADQFQVVTGGGERMEINSTNTTITTNLIVSSTKSFTCGTITASGSITTNSDERIKDNIAVIPDALEKVKAIRGVTYTRTDIEDTETVHVGVIAQEVEAVLPEAVRDDENGIKTVAYGNMVGLLIEAIKEQQVQIDELKKRIK